MKLGKKSISKPELNRVKRRSGILMLLAVTVGLIVWVQSMESKSEKFVAVTMLSKNVGQQEEITEEMLVEYKMTQAEYEKYAVINDNGVKTRRLVLWDDRAEIIHAFASYPLQQEKLLEYRDLVQSRVDNSDTLLYNYPGKDAVKMELGENDISAFKTYLKPGDRINVDALFTDKVEKEVDDGYGNKTLQEVEVYRTETVFRSIMVADLVNGNGKSILDIYENYNAMSVWEQAQLDASESFQQSVTPNALMLALTPEEKSSYYKYLRKQDVRFVISLPQRVE